MGGHIGSKPLTSEPLASLPTLDYAENLHENTLTSIWNVIDQAEVHLFGSKATTQAAHIVEFKKLGTQFKVVNDNTGLHSEASYFASV